MKMDAAVPFNTPVDPVALGIPVSITQVITSTQLFSIYKAVQNHSFILCLLSYGYFKN